MKASVITFVLCLVSLMSNAQTVPFVGALPDKVIEYNADTITTTIVVEGDKEIDIIDVASKSPHVVKLFNFYSKVEWTCELTFDGEAIVEERNMKRVRFIKIVAICSEPLQK